MSKVYTHAVYRKGTVLAICLMLVAGCIQQNRKNNASESMVSAQSRLDQKDYDRVLSPYTKIF